MAALAFTSCITDPGCVTSYYVVNHSGHDLTLFSSEPADWHIAKGDTCLLGTSEDLGNCLVDPALVLGYGDTRILFDDSTTLCYAYVPPLGSATADSQSIFDGLHWESHVHAYAPDDITVSAENAYYTISEEDYRRAHE